MFEKNTKKCFLAPFWPLFWPKLVKMTKKIFFLDSDAKPFPTRGHMPIFEQNYDNWYFRSQNGLSGPKKARKFWKTLKSSLGSWESLETIRICIIRQIRSAKVDIFTKTISPPHPRTAMIAIPLRAISGRGVKNDYVSPWRNSSILRNRKGRIHFNRISRTHFNRISI